MYPHFLWLTDNPSYLLLDIGGKQTGPVPGTLELRSGARMVVPGPREKLDMRKNWGRPMCNSIYKIIQVYIYNSIL